MDISFSNSQNLYGIPERAYSLSLRDTIQSEPYRLYNLDIFRYEIGNPIGLYGTVPIIWSIGPKSAAGVLGLNPSETFIDVEKKQNTKEMKTQWVSETGVLDYFFLPGPTPKKIYNQYAFLTGKPYLPQYFSIAHHQCRWNYKDEEDVMNVDESFDVHNIPYDVIWLDIEHTDDKQYFTFDPVHFSDPIRLQNNLKNKGRKLVTITDPHIKRKDGYFVHEDSSKKNYYIKNSDGKTDFEGNCWPGKSSWLDFTNPDVREFWAELYTQEKYQKTLANPPVVYTWIDMNEPCF